MRRAASVAVGFLVIPTILAQSANVTPEDEYKKKLRITEDVQPLGDDPFGENISTYNGGLSWAQVDVSESGTGPTLELRRTFKIPDLPPNRYFQLAMNNALVDWTLEVPHIESISAEQTLTDGAGHDFNQWFFLEKPLRCTNFSAAPSIVRFPKPGFDPIQYDASDWWHGYQLVVSGGTQDLLSRDPSNSVVPQMTLPNGQAVNFKIATTKNWAIGCTPSTANGKPGEGFLVLSPDGTKYWMDWLAYKPADTIAHAGGGALFRRDVSMLVSKIEDRFGNSVTYQYDASGNPTAIQGSDGRSLVLTYDTWQHPSKSSSGAFNYPPAVRLRSATLQPGTSGARTWTYNYGSDPALPRLSEVRLPDGSSWSLAMDGLVSPRLGGEVEYSGCGYLGAPAPSAPSSATMHHPSGLTGVFTIRTITRGMSYTPKVCQQVADTQVVKVPHVYRQAAITQKTFSGAGTSARTWNYNYSPSNESWESDCGAGCASTVWTDIVDPENRSTRYTFSNRYDVTNSQLLRTDYYNGAVGSALLRSEVYEYASAIAGPWPAKYGSSQQLYVNKDQLERLSPQRRRILNQDGNAFTHEVTAFDGFAQPTKVKRFNDIAGQPSIEEQTTYLNDLPHWVLGLPARSINLNTSETVSSTDYNLASVTPSARYGFGQKLMSYSFNPQGQLASFTDGNNKTTTLGNYKRGVPQAIGYPDGTSQNLTVDDFGQVTFITNQVGANTSYQYDGVGRLVRIGYTGADGISWAPTTVDYQFVGSERGISGNHWRQIVARGSRAKAVYFDAMMRPILTESYRASDGQLGTAVRTDYDWKGNKTFVSYPMAGSPALGAMSSGVATAYDSLGRPSLTRQTSELGDLTTATTYLSGARQQFTDAKGYVTTTTYQVFDEPSYDKTIQVQAPEGVTQTITRDLYGNPTSLVQSGNGKSVTKTMIYDASKRLCRTTEPESGSEVMAYDSANNLAWSASGLSISGGGCGQEQVSTAAKIVRSYDPMNRVLSVTYPTGTESTSFTYDPLGNPATATSWPATWTYTHNKLSLLTAEVLSVEGYQWAIGYGYDVGANLSTIAYPDNKIISYAPDALGRPTQVGTYANGVSYFPDGDLESFTFGSGATYLAEKNTRNILSSFTYGKGASLDVSEDLTYDANANIRQITDLTNNGQRTKVLSYDQLNRLTSATASNLWGAESYTYDALNNITGLTNSGGTNTYNYDVNNLLKTVTNNGATIHAFQYDPRGNTINKNNVALTFDQANRLTAIQDKGTYLYDAAGRRVKKIQTGSAIPRYYMYSQSGQLMFQFDPATLLGTDYLYLGKKLIATRESVNSQVVGTIDGVFNLGGTYTITGWACTTGVVAPIKVDLYVGGPAGSGTAINRYDTNLTSEPAVGVGCKAAGTAYRFSIPIANATRSNFPGAAIYIHGISPFGNGNPLLDHSGSFTIPPAAGQPASVTTTLATNLSTLTANWTSVSDATSYTAQYQRNGGAWTALSSGAALSAVIANPVDGAYVFRVQGCNTIGCGKWTTSATINVYHPPGVPPTISVPATSTGSFTVSWAAPTGTVTAYVLEYSHAGGPYAVAYTGTALSQSQTSQTTSSYTYRVKACNGPACSAYRTSGTVVVTIPPASAPVITAPAISNNGSYTVSWNAIGGATSYTLQEQVNGGGWSTIQTGAGASRALSGKGNGTYGYRVQGSNAGGPGPWGAVKATTVALLPLVPASVRGTVTYPNPKRQTLTIAWSAGAYATRYEVKQNETGGQTVYNGTGFSVLAESIQFGEPWGFSYSVRSCNSVGCSAWVRASGY
jgi:YD repeat-containing protein